MAGGAAGSSIPNAQQANSDSHWWDFLFNTPVGLPTPNYSLRPAAAPTPQPQQLNDQGFGLTVTPSPIQHPTSTASTAPTGMELNNQREQQFVKQNYNYNIWTGNTAPSTTRRYGSGGKSSFDQPTGTAVPVPTYAGDYIQQWQTASSADIASLQTRLINATLLNPNGVVKGSWDPATENALSLAMAQSANHPNDPTFTVDSYINQRIAYNQKHGLIPGPKTYTVNSTSTDFNLSDPETAKGLLSQALEQYLGHSPTDSEVKSFTTALNAQERAHPRVTKSKSVRTTDTTGVTTERSNSSVTTGGYNGQSQYATDYAKAQPGSAEFQAASLVDALDQMLKGPAGPGG